MKKTLLATTAIVGAACAFNPAFAQQVNTSQPFTVTLGGFFNSHMSVISSEDLPTPATQSRAKKVRFLNDAEIWFTVQAKADNGLVYGFRVELETINGESPTPSTGSGLVDEANIFAQGGFGRVELGNEDSFADRFFGYMPLAWAMPTGYGVYPDTGFLGRMTLVSNSQLEGLTQKVFDSSDAAKVSYATPNFGGFQAGISYAPDGQSDTGVVARFADSVQTADVSGGMLTRGGYSNFLEIGATYSGTWGPVGVRGGITYNHADAKNAIAGVSYEDFSGWGIGGMFTVAGFSLGASFLYEGDSRLQKTGRAFSDDAYGFNVTAQYAIGPWTIGAYWAESEMEGASTVGTTSVRGLATNNSGNDELRMIGAGVAYTVAPGMLVHFSIVDFEEKNEGRTANDGQIYTITTRISF